jgi:hypothetical protein
VILGAGGRRAAIVATRLGYGPGREPPDEQADALALEMDVDSWPGRMSRRAKPTCISTDADRFGRDPPAVPAPSGEPSLVFDSVYRRDGSPTSTIRAARAASCAVVEGIRMFAAQAVPGALFGVEDATAEEVAGLLGVGRPS